VLEPPDVVRLLLDRGLVDARHLVNGDLTVLDCSRRNRNFKVLSGPEHGYVVKQGLTDEKRATVRHEAAIYGLLRAAPKVAHLVPRLRVTGRDAVIVVEMTRGSQNLREYHERSGGVPRSIAASLGSAVAAIHTHVGAAGVESSSPHGLALHRPDLAVFRHASQGCLEVARIITQSPSLAAAIDQLREGWTASAFIHADLRLDNCIVTPPAGAGRRHGMQLVDWELARWGDPAWDVGSVFAEFLAIWIASAPLSERTPPESFLQFALHPLDAMWPALRAFWQAYCRGTHRTDEANRAFLEHALRFTGARLVQRAFESVQSATTATPLAVLMLQLADNIMARPAVAGPQLLGID